MLNKRLGDEIRALIVGKKKQHKEVAIAFAQRMNLKESTAISDLSELLNAKPGSERKFFATEDQTLALAKALGVTTDRLQKIFKRCERGRYLVLDPSLDAAGKDFLLQQQNAGGVAYECVAVSDGSDLRKAADSSPGCIVVLKNDSDRSYYEGARIATTRVEKVPRGYRLIEFPDLVPISPSAPAAAWDAGGQPLFSSIDLVAGVRREAAARRLNANNIGDTRGFHSSDRRDESVEKMPWLSDLSHDKVVALARRVFAADASGDESSFPLSEVVAWLKASAGEDWQLELPQARERGSVTIRLEQIVGEAKSTIVWWWKQHLFAIGPSASAFAKSVRPMHKVSVPPELESWLAALDTHNPFDPSAFDPLVEAANANAGVSLKDATAAWARKVADADDRAKNLRLLRFSKKEESGARAILRALADRPKIVSRTEATLSLQLRAASRAPLQLLPKTRFDVMHVIAGLGAGRVVRVRVAQFKGAARGELAVSRRSDSGAMLELDGDGTHVWIESSYDEQLEGMYVRARVRRKAETADQSDDD